MTSGNPANTPAVGPLSNAGTPATGATTLLSDHLGSVRALVGTSGTVAGVEAAFTYDTYGQSHALAGLSLSALTAVAGPIGDTPSGPAAGGASALTPFGFDGAYTDGSTGLEYLIHRYYDPTTGTFLSVDPLVGITGDPYGYVSGDPVNGVDPLGLCNADPTTASYYLVGNCLSGLWGHPDGGGPDTWQGVVLQLAEIVGYAVAIATGVRAGLFVWDAFYGAAEDGAAASWASALRGSLENIDFPINAMVVGFSVVPSVVGPAALIVGGLIWLGNHGSGGGPSKSSRSTVGSAAGCARL